MNLVYEFSGPSRMSTASRNFVNLGKMENEGMPEFPHHPMNQQCPLQMAITFSSKL